MQQHIKICKKICKNPKYAKQIYVIFAYFILILETLGH